MLLEVLQKLFRRDLNKLHNEMALYTKEENIWKVEGNIANSAGNLCMHLIGNLNTHIGSVLGNTGYVRNREFEFSGKNVARATLLRQIEETIRVVDAALDRLEEGDLPAEYPLLVFQEKTTTEYMLVHLVTHLGYHLGQVNYHRRLLDM